MRAWLHLRNVHKAMGNVEKSSEYHKKLQAEKQVRGRADMMAASKIDVGRCFASHAPCRYILLDTASLFCVCLSVLCVSVCVVSYNALFKTLTFFCLTLSLCSPSPPPARDCL